MSCTLILACRSWSSCRPVQEPCCSFLSHPNRGHLVYRNLLQYCCHSFVGHKEMSKSSNIQSTASGRSQILNNARFSIFCFRTNAVSLCIHRINLKLWYCARDAPRLPVKLWFHATTSAKERYPGQPSCNHGANDLRICS